MTCAMAMNDDDWQDREDRESYRSDAYDDEMAEPRRSYDEIMLGASICDEYEDDDEDDSVDWDEEDDE